MAVSRGWLVGTRLPLLTVAVFAFGLNVSSGQEGAAARCLEVQGTLLARSGATWQAVKSGDNIAAGTTLVSLFAAELESANQAVAIKLMGDIGDFGPLPVLDTAIRLEASSTADAALTLQRGLVIFTNQRKNGAATVVVKMKGEELEIKLKSPGAKIGLEMYGRHPGGAGHILKDDPTTFVYALVGQGAVVLSTKMHTYALAAPPGQAMLRWDSVTRQAEVVSLEKFPAELKRTDNQLKTFTKMCSAAQGIAGKNPGAAAAELVKAADSLDRRVGVTALGAVDDLPRLLAALGDAQNHDVREQAILVLRTWIGRSSGQLKPLRVAMLKQKYAPVQMATTMHLLFGFDEQERQRPAIYELLIQLLDSKHVSVRELAHWHLVRLAPAGRDIPFDAGAADADRQRGVERWRQLIPVGALPPAPKKEKQ